MIRLCAWCEAEKRAPVETVTNCTCERHAEWVHLTDAVDAAIAAFEGPEYLSTERRAQLAASLRSVVRDARRRMIRALNWRDPKASDPSGGRDE